MKGTLAESAELVGDGGGIVTSFPKPMVGGQRIAQLSYAAIFGTKGDLCVEPVMISGCLGLWRYLHGELESEQSYDTDGDKIVRVYMQRNPAKLRRIVARQVFVLR